MRARWAIDSRICRGRGQGTGARATPRWRRLALIRRPRRVIAWVASAATPIATSARSAVGSGRTADRNWSARARSTTRRMAWPRWVSRQRPLAAVLGLLVGARRAAAGRGRRRAGSSPTATGRSPRPARRRSSCSPSARTYSAASWVKPRRSSPSCAGEADDQLAPERPAHRHPLADLADVRQPVAGREDRRGEVRLEAAGRWPGAARSAGRSAAGRRRSDTTLSVRSRRESCATVHRLRPWRQALRGATLARDEPRSPSSSPARARSRVGMGRALAGRVARPPRPSSPRPTPPSASRSAALAWDGPAETARPDRERPAGPPRDVDRLSSRRSASAGRRAGARRRPAPGLRGRPLDGPVLGPGRGRGPRLDDGVRLVRERGRLMQASRRRAATARWPRSSGSTTRGSPSSSPAPRPHGIFVVANRNAPGPGRRLRRAGRRRGRRRARPRRSAPSGRSSCPSRSRPTRR